jgi:tRNA/rRNA methyltransferase
LTNIHKPLQDIQISFILVEPAVPENIGAAARAIKTMGFTDFRLVKPSGHLADEAKWLAHGSHDILDNASIFTEFKTAIQDLDFVIGTTAKNRSVKADYYNPEEARNIVLKKNDSISKVGIVFGREESGLKNEELKICDIASSVNLKNPYPSINLAQSVMIYAYIFSSFNLSKPGKNDVPEEKGRIFNEMKNNAADVLHDLQINKNPNLYHRILERIATVNNDDARLILSFAKKFKQKFE